MNCDISFTIYLVGRSAKWGTGEVLKLLLMLTMFWVFWVNPTVPIMLPLHGDTGITSRVNGSTRTKDSASGANHDFKVMKNPLSFSPVLFSLNYFQLMQSYKSIFHFYRMTRIEYHADLCDERITNMLLDMDDDWIQKGQVLQLATAATCHQKNNKKRK